MAKYNLKKDFKKQSAISYFKKLLDKGALIELREIRSKRTINQNDLYWLYLTCIAVETGNNKDDLHEYFKHKLLNKQLIEIFGETISKISTTNLDTKQFTTYLTSIVNFALMELNIVMPNPDDKRLLDFYNEYKEFL